MKRLVGLVAAMLLLAVAFAETQAEVSVIDHGSFTWTPSNTHFDAVNGHVYEVNATVNQSTMRWAGVYGQINGLIVLGDSSGNVFYQWTPSVTGSYVYFTVDSDIDMGSLTAVSEGDIQTAAPWLDRATDDYSDSWSNTFTATENMVTPGEAVSNAPYATIASNFKCYSVRDGAVSSGSLSNLVWAAKGNADQTLYGSVTADYACLLPEKGTEDDTAATTYNVFVELR